MMIGKTNAVLGGSEVIVYDASLSTVDISGATTIKSRSPCINIGPAILPNGATTKVLIPNNSGLNIEINISNFSFNYSAGNVTRYYCQIDDNNTIGTIIESLKSNGLKLPDGKYKIKLYASDNPNPTVMSILDANTTFNIKVENNVWNPLSYDEAGGYQYVILPRNSLLSSAYLFPLFITKFEI